MDMRHYIKVRTELAHTYACDGAYQSAARILADVAAVVAEHAKRLEEEGASL